MDIADSVKGAGRGIGAAISRALAEAGARVALVARTESDLTALAAQLDATGQTGAPAAGRHRP